MSGPGAGLLPEDDAMFLVLLMFLLIAVAVGRKVAHRTPQTPNATTTQPLAGSVQSRVPSGPVSSQEPDAVDATPEPAPDLTGWTDHELALAWRSSFLRLQRLQETHQSVGVNAVARERGRYLDELERRHPTGFSAWIASGARAPSDPSRFMGLRHQTRRDGQDA